MNKLKKYMMIDCYAFTVIVLINAMFQALGLAEEVPMSYGLYIFLTSTVVAALMLLTDRFVRGKEKQKGMIYILDVLVPVLFFSMLQTQFHLSFKEVATTVGICLIVYGIVYLMMYLSWREKDARFNEIIQKMRSKK